MIMTTDNEELMDALRSWDLHGAGRLNQRRGHLEDVLTALTNAPVDAPREQQRTLAKAVNEAHRALFSPVDSLIVTAEQVGLDSTPAMRFRDAMTSTMLFWTSFSGIRECMQDPVRLRTFTDAQREVGYLVERLRLRWAIARSVAHVGSTPDGEAKRRPSLQTSNRETGKAKLAEMLKAPEFRRLKQVAQAAKLTELLGRKVSPRTLRDWMQDLHGG